MSPVDPNKPYTGDVRKCPRCGREFDSSRLNADRECEQCADALAAAMAASPENRDPAAGGPPVEPGARDPQTQDAGSVAGLETPGDTPATTNPPAGE